MDWNNEDSRSLSASPRGALCDRRDNRAEWGSRAVSSVSRAAELPAEHEVTRTATRSCISRKPGESRLSEVECRTGSQVARDQRTRISSISVLILIFPFLIIPFFPLSFFVFYKCRGHIPLTKTYFLNTKINNINNQVQKRSRDGSRSGGAAKEGAEGERVRFADAKRLSTARSASRSIQKGSRITPIIFPFFHLIHFQVPDQFSDKALMSHFTRFSGQLEDLFCCSWIHDSLISHLQCI